MGILDDIGTHLDSTVGALTLGTNLFLSRLPDDPDTCVAVFEYSGDAPMSTMGGDGFPPIEQPRIQLLTRAAGYSTAHDLASTCWVALEQVLNETLTSTTYLRVAANQSPFPLERDTSDRVIFAQNFRVQRAS